MTTKMASNMDDTLGGSQTQSQSLLDKNYVDVVMASPSVEKVDVDPTSRKRALSGEDTMCEDTSKKIKPSDSYGLIWFDFCFTALRHILGHFGHGQLT